MTGPSLRLVQTRPNLVEHPPRVGTSIATIRSCRAACAWLRARQHDLQRLDSQQLAPRACMPIFCVDHRTIRPQLTATSTTRPRGPCAFRPRPHPVGPPVDTVDLEPRHAPCCPYAQGWCRLGAACRYAHNPHEVESGSSARAKGDGGRGMGRAALVEPLRDEVPPVLLGAGDAVAGMKETWSAGESWDARPGSVW